MTQKFVDVRPLAYRLLTPNATLDVRLFDYRGHMRPEVRQQLLANAEYVINNTIKPIGGLTVRDIYVYGSAAGYFYADSSDIDIGIEICNENCPYLAKDEKKLFRFLSLLYQGNIKSFRFTLVERSVDIHFKTISDRGMIGIYSLLYDHWEIEPDKNITQGVTYDEIMADYTKKYDDINAYIEEVKQSEKLNSSDSINELNDYYLKISHADKSDTCARIWNYNYIIRKLLSHRGVFQKVRNLISDTLTEYLSIK